jgi:hypothetical protein
VSTAAGVVSPNWKLGGFNATADVAIAATIPADGNSYTLVGTNTNLTGRSWNYNSTTGVITENTPAP